MAIKSIVQSPYNVRCVRIEYDEKDDKPGITATLVPVAGVLALLAREELDRYWVAEMESAVPAGVSRSDMEAIIETVKFPAFRASKERWGSDIQLYTDKFGVEAERKDNVLVIGTRGQAWLEKAFI